MELILPQKPKGRFPKGHEPFNKGLKWDNYISTNGKKKILKTLAKYRHLAHSNYPKYRYKVIMFTKEDKLIGVFLDSVDAMKKTGIEGRNIRNVCEGNRKHAGGFKWKYEKDI